METDSPLGKQKAAAAAEEPLDLTAKRESVLAEGLRGVAL
jgi:hypothetical protein